MTSRRQRADDRAGLVADFIVSEEQYLSEIDSIIVNYVSPLEENMEYFGLFQEQIDRIFGPIKRLQEFHEVFCNVLKNTDTPVVDSFMNFMSLKKTYEVYIKGHEEVIVTLANLKGNQKFYQFLTEKESGKGLRKKILPGLLMQPFQRVTEYFDFFRQLSVFTTSDHPEYEKVVHVHSKILELSNGMKRYQSRYENMTNLLRIQMRILGDFESFVAPKRFLVYEQEVTFESNDDNVQYNLFLFNDLLLWTTLKGAYVDSCEFLESTFQFGEEDANDLAFWFGVHGQKQTVFSSSMSGRDDWVSMIGRHRNRVLKDQIRRNERATFGSRAPSLASSRSRTSLRDRAGSIASRSSRGSITSPHRTDLTPKYTRSHRSSIASSQGGYGFDRGGSAFGSVRDFDTASHRSGYSARSGTSRARARSRKASEAQMRRRKQSDASIGRRKQSDASMGRVRMGDRKGSATMHQSQPSTSTLPSTRGLGNNLNSYANSEFSDDSISLKASTEFNSQQLQKVYQRLQKTSERLQKAQQKIQKYEEASKAQKKLVRDLNDSNSELRKLNQTLRKEKKDLERELKRLKKHVGSSDPKGRRRERGGKKANKHSRRPSFTNLLLESQAATTPMTTQPQQQTQFANVAGINVVAVDPNQMITAPVQMQVAGQTFLTDQNGQQFIVAGPDEFGQQPLTTTGLAGQPMYIQYQNV